jgi:type I restriction enzyme, R subunit
MSPPEILNENTVEQAALSWLEELGYTKLHGPDIAEDGPRPERSGYSEVVIRGRLESAIKRLNPKLPVEAVEEALRKVLNPAHPSLILNNRAFHLMLANGVEVQYRRKDGTQAAEPVRLINFDDPTDNDFVACNQFTIIEGNINRRPDLIVFVNGLPLAALEFKNPTADKPTLLHAFNQLQTYKTQISSLFIYNELMIVSDGLEAYVGSLTADRERFMPWKTVNGDKIAPNNSLWLEVLLRGIFEKARFISLLRHFVLFEDSDRGELTKKLAGYHQFHAVRKAVIETLKAAKPNGNRKVGVVWHTQGSGKSLTMTFYAGALVAEPEMQNPTLVVITDRNDLDEQLFGQFARSKDLLRQTPHQAEDRDDLKKLLSVGSGGIIFTTIQKFLPEGKGEKFPVLSDRKNIVVVADEAHRSQYGFKAKVDTKSGDINVGFAQHLRDALPNASFIGFTGTPVELTDKSTRAVFGDYIDVYDIQQAVEDKATVPIFYESRLAKLKLKQDAVPHLDSEFDEVTEGQEDDTRQKLKSKWAQLEALVGSETRIKEIARDLINHFETRQEALDGGKAMIVCMSRRICVALYDELIRLRPKWHDPDDAKGALKVIMTGSAADKPEFQPHIRSKARLTELAKRFRKPQDPFQIVIVRDMWLTGFDAPCMHTLYVDKPMRGHGLMQAIARVNRVFKNKAGGLVVDYLGIADQLKEALGNYTANNGRGDLYIDQEEAVEVMETKYEVVFQMFHGFNWTVWKTGTPPQRLALLPNAQEHILKQKDGKQRYLKAVTELSKAYSLAASHERAAAIRDDVAFFSVIRTVLTRPVGMTGKTIDDMEFALGQLVSKAVASEGVMDVFEAAGLKKPEISILSEHFLAEIQNMPQKNLALELLSRLLNGEIKVRAKNNLVQARSFAEMLETALKKYQNRAIETAQIIEELIRMAKDFNEAMRRGEHLGLSSDEAAFYDALEVNDSAVKGLGEPILRQIAQDLVKEIKASIKIDWTERENVRAEMRVRVKRLLRKHGYPPDKQEKATQTVIQQAELLCRDWIPV